ncbi:hypothetical protein GFS24_27175 [Chitinophaga sp. SYP-B3965]|uniref:hypothetical protein n=1 Tax=Chitinophaga sp. SYP-B3965 TaxID=2663120 RepID=UPI00129991D4|nr:hypothetical protein [Chitinophaga sp. SYP-B3965]MRG48822.1 hypothetical protein [Chitinophaga sp. SYP-B3965]
MKADELEDIWQAYDAKLAQSLELNIKVLEKIEGQKVRRSFIALIRFKLFAIILGIPWNAFLLFLLYYAWREPFFAISAILLVIINTYAMIEYARQIRVIRGIDVSNAISITQQQLTWLHISVIRSFRIIFLQLPLWTIFYIKVPLLMQAGWSYWIIQSLITLLFIFITIWLYRNISVKNAGSKWVKALIWEDGGKSFDKATKFMQEIEEFKKDIL